MLDSFRIRAVTIKRNIKISAYLPKDYYKTDKKYPLLILFDGQYFFKFLDEDKRIIDFNSILESENRDFIVIAPHAPKEEMPDWRISELNPYYNGNHEQVDKILAYIYADYIANDLIKFLKDKYRVSDDIYLYSSDLSSILGIYMIYRYDNFKGLGLFLPKIDDVDDKFKNDIIKNMKKDKKIYIYSGESDNEDYYKIYQLLDKETNNIMLDYIEDENDDYENIKNHINTYFDYLLK